MQKVNWCDVQNDEIVYIDNYENGKFPNASPKVSGPFVVVDKTQRVLKQLKLIHEVIHGRTFQHLPENLLRKKH